MKTITRLFTMGAVLWALAASAQSVQLDISSGFNTDNWTGYREFQQVVLTGNTDLQEAQGANPVNGQGRKALDAFNYGMIGAIDQTTADAQANGVYDGVAGRWNGYATNGSWWRPGYKSDSQGTPLNGVLTSAGDGRVYHIASHAGNATLMGDWLQAEDVSFVGTGASVTSPMAMKMNAMTMYAPHSIAGGQLDSTTATLGGAQQGLYTDINFVLAAWDTSDGARNARIVAVYGDASEETLYSFSTADGVAGPTHEGTGVFNPADFTVVHTFTQGYNVAGGTTGSVSDKTGYFYEFTNPLALNSAKTLVGIRLEDSNPTLNNNERGLSIYGATATAIPEPSTLVLLGLSIGLFVLNRRRRR